MALVHDRVMEGPYTYRVLRYVHHVGTAEFINVGVVVASCDAPCVAAKFNTDYRRAKGAIPSLETEILLARMTRLQRASTLSMPPGVPRCAPAKACPSRD
ncbi:DUF3037 domain-containing protein [Variovorax sp. LjRoot130]|uniref:DUF3037 domain-containing protein n=1 Tax=Variovorax sp. LjRoot130 TaxID=3342261 RepID=UPI003ECC6833